MVTGKSKPMHETRFAKLAMVMAALTAGTAAQATLYQQTNLVTDDQAALTGLGFAPALTVDPTMVNPWGIAESATGPFWTANQGTGTSTLYTGAGNKVPLTVTIPATPGGPQVRPVRYSPAAPGSCCPTARGTVSVF